jgi:hypothetical protein
MDNTCTWPVFHKQFPNERKAWFLITVPVITLFPSVIMLCHVTDQSEIHWCQFPLLSGTWQKNCLGGLGRRVFVWPVSHLLEIGLTTARSGTSQRFTIRSWSAICGQSIVLCVTHHNDYAYIHWGSVNPTVLEKAQKYKDVASGYENVMINANRVMRNYHSKLINISCYVMAGLLGLLICYHSFHCSN